MIFVDEIVIHIQSGNGGKGCESYYRRTDKKMVPTGGDGGEGGDIIIRADRNATNLYSFRFNKHYRAESGHHGSGNQMKGRDGADLMIRVPCGTTILNKKDHLLIRDLVHDGEEVVVLRGGRGGMGNSHHGREATLGKNGQSLEVVLNLKIHADIFLVGNPNSGKSLLLNYLTHAKAKSETYPFSTKAPQLGIYETSDFRTLTLCELPPIVRGSSKGKGLGNQFLKHLARARLIFLMLDPFQDDFDLVSGYNDLNAEILAFDPALAAIPHFLVVSKMDIPQVKERFEHRKVNISCLFFLISAQTGNGIDSLMKEAERLVFQTC